MIKSFASTFKLVVNQAWLMNCAQATVIRNITESPRLDREPLLTESPRLDREPLLTESPRLDRGGQASFMDTTVKPW